ncbi:MAG: hypothetical protein ACQZ2J_27590 [Pseudomonas piscis]|uniref:hypothetical protein n=1 Tax=Pseudomonas TaxID=286 RepID=UPI001357796D|nr:hypothetical protein [Pseudomonas sp. LD120]KAF0865901.1 hypothetical protein PLD_11700 [Pseudomonas sp. LD120]
MKLNRELQRALLEELRVFYPRRSQSAYQLDGYTQVECINNLVYLEEHGLIESGVKLGSSNGSVTLTQARITARGMDFLEEDGGLGAALGVVTIKIHEDTLRELLERKILESDTPPEEKSRLVQRLKGLSAEAIKHLTLKLLDEGVGRLPATVALIGTYLQQVLQ